MILIDEPHVPLLTPEIIEREMDKWWDSVFAKRVAAADGKVIFIQARLTEADRLDEVSP